MSISPDGHAADISGTDRAGVRVWVRLLAALVVGAVRGLPVPASDRRRQQLLVRSAADVISALGVRVEVHAPAVAWPRGRGRLVVTNRVGRLGDLALLTAVPGTLLADAQVASRPVAGRLLRRAGGVFLDPSRLHALPGVVADITRRLRTGGAVLVHPEGTTSSGAHHGRFRAALFEAAIDASAPVCPVAIRYRTSAPAGSLAGGSPARSVRRIVATRGLVVEVHLLPALDPAGADRRTLAALAEYAVAEVVEARAPVAIRPRAVRLFDAPDRPVAA